MLDKVDASKNGTMHSWWILFVDFTMGFQAGLGPSVVPASFESKRKWTAFVVTLHMLCQPSLYNGAIAAIWNWTNVRFNLFMERHKDLRLHDLGS